MNETDNPRRVERLYHIVGCPTVQNFEHILQQGIIKIAEV
jgi:hypothetical protein